MRRPHSYSLHMEFRDGTIDDPFQTVPNKRQAFTLARFIARGPARDAARVVVYHRNRTRVLALDIPGDSEKPRMTPTRFRECLALLDWSQRGLAKLLQRPEGTVRQWGRGTVQIPDDIAEWLEFRSDNAAKSPPPSRPQD